MNAKLNCLRKVVAILIALSVMLVYCMPQRSLSVYADTTYQKSNIPGAANNYGILTYDHNKAFLPTSGGHAPAEFWVDGVLQYRSSEDAFLWWIPGFNLKATYSSNGSPYIFLGFIRDGDAKLASNFEAGTSTSNTASWAAGSGRTFSVMLSTPTSLTIKVNNGDDIPYALRNSYAPEVDSLVYRYESGQAEPTYKYYSDANGVSEINKPSTPGTYWVKGNLPRNASSAPCESILVEYTILPETENVAVNYYDGAIAGPGNLLGTKILSAVVGTPLSDITYAKTLAEVAADSELTFNLTSGVDYEDVLSHETDTLTYVISGGPNIINLRFVPKSEGAHGDNTGSNNLPGTTFSANNGGEPLSGGMLDRVGEFGIVGDEVLEDGIIIDDTDTPLAPGGINIGGDQITKAAPGISDTLSLTNMFILITNLLLAGLLWAAFREKNWLVKLAGAAFAVAGGVIFVISEDFSIQLGFNIDKGTIPQAIFLVCEVIVIAIAIAKAGKINQEVSEQSDSK